MMNLVVLYWAVSVRKKYKVGKTNTHYKGPTSKSVTKL